MLSEAASRGAVLVGLTGGMGAGKSTVARLLADHGAHVVDADAIAREVVAPGEPALAAIAERFGDDVLGEDGTLDRAAVASIVFADDEALDDLEAITHPAIRDRVVDHVARLAGAHEAPVVVLDHPLLVESGLHADVDVVVVVQTPVEQRLDRLEEHRGVDRDDARARMRSQASDDQRRAVADHVLVNDDDEQALRAEVDALWPLLRERRDAQQPRGGSLRDDVDDQDVPRG